MSNASRDPGRAPNPYHDAAERAALGLDDSPTPPAPDRGADRSELPWWAPNAWARCDDHMRAEAGSAQETEATAALWLLHDSITAPIEARAREAEQRAEEKWAAEFGRAVEAMAHAHLTKEAARASQVCTEIEQGLRAAGLDVPTHATPADLVAAALAAREAGREDVAAKVRGVLTHLHDEDDLDLLEEIAGIVRPAPSPKSTEPAAHTWKLGNKLHSCTTCGLFWGPGAERFPCKPKFTKATPMGGTPEPAPRLLEGLSSEHAASLPDLWQWDTAEHVAEIRRLRARLAKLEATPAAAPSEPKPARPKRSPQQRRKRRLARLRRRMEHLDSKGEAGNGHDRAEASALRWALGILEATPAAAPLGAGPERRYVTGAELERYAAAVRDRASAPQGGPAGPSYEQRLAAANADGEDVEHRRVLAQLANGHPNAAREIARLMHRARPPMPRADVEKLAAPRSVSAPQVPAPSIDDTTRPSMSVVSPEGADAFLMPLAEYLHDTAPMRAQPEPDVVIADPLPPLDPAEEQRRVDALLAPYVPRVGDKEPTVVDTLTPCCNVPGLTYNGDPVHRDALPGLLKLQSTREGLPGALVYDGKPAALFAKADGIAIVTASDPHPTSDEPGEVE